MCGIVMFVCVCMCEFCNVWVCVSVSFVMCGCFGNMCTCIYCVFVSFVMCGFVYVCFEMCG